MTTTGSASARPTRKESQEETRRRLVDAAIGLFSEHGVDATSLRSIAEHAGYTRGAVHGNFADKDALLAAVVSAVVGELGPRLGEILASGEPSGTRLAEYIRTFLAYCAGNPARAGALIAVVEHLGRRERDHYENRADASLDDLVALFDDGRRRGEMRDFDSRTMAFALRTVLDSTAARLRRDPADVEALTTEITALFDAATRKENHS